MMEESVVRPLPHSGVQTHWSCCAHMCHLGLRSCSGNSRLLSLMTMLAKSVSSTKSEVMMFTPSCPGLWASTQDMMVGRFLEPPKKRVCVRSKTITKKDTPMCSTEHAVTWFQTWFTGQVSVSTGYDNPIAETLPDSNQLFLGWMSLCVHHIWRKAADKVFEIK